MSNPYGSEWIPPYDCSECRHSSFITRRCCTTCLGPENCIHCKSRTPKGDDEPPIFPSKPQPGPGFDP